MEVHSTNERRTSSFSTAWKNAIARDNQISAGWTGANTSTATLEQIQTATREIYKNYPEILRALGLLLRIIWYLQNGD